MPVSPAGALNTPLDKLADLLAHSAAFQTWVNAQGADATEKAADAKTRVYLYAPPAPADGVAYTLDEQQGLRPYVVVWPTSLIMPRIGTGPTRRNSGQITARFEAEISEQYEGSEDDAEVEFTNAVGNILDELWGISEGLGYLCPNQIQMPEPPQRVADESEPSEGAFFSVEVLFDW